MVTTHQQPMATNQHEQLPSLIVTQEPPQSPRGVKRHAEDGLEGEQRLSKRFDLLKLGHTGKLWTPPPGQQQPKQQQEQEHQHDFPTPTPTSKPIPSTARNANDGMQLDDTPNRIYIHDLDAELDSPSSSDREDHDDDHLTVHNATLDRQLSSLPAHLLRSSSGARPQPTNALVLYRPPAFPIEDQHSMRTAIIEARARARERSSGVAAGMRRLEEEPPALARGEAARAAVARGRGVLTHDWRGTDGGGDLYGDWESERREETAEGEEVDGEPMDIG